MPPLPATEHLSTREGYDRWSEIYDQEQNPLIALEEPHVADLLGDVRDLTVADIGCGTGRHALRLAAAGARVLAVDFSEGMLARASVKASTQPWAERLDLRRHDVTKPLPFLDDTFDRVVCALMLDHVEDLHGLLLELGRIMKPAGFAVVSVMHPAMLERGVQARFFDPRTGREIRPRSEPHQIRDYRAAIEAAGLRIDHLSEHAVDDALARRVPRAAKYLGWPLLLLFRLARGDELDA